MGATTHKGDYAELMIAADIIKHGFIICKPNVTVHNPLE